MKWEFTVSKGHYQYALPYNMVNYTSWPIILPNIKAIWPTTSIRGVVFTKYNYNIENAWKRYSPITKIVKSKWWDNIYGSTTQHTELSYEIWKLLNKKWQVAFKKWSGTDERTDIFRTWRVYCSSDFDEVFKKKMN